MGDDEEGVLLDELLILNDFWRPRIYRALAEGTTPARKPVHIKDADHGETAPFIDKWRTKNIIPKLKAGLKLFWKYIAGLKHPDNIVFAAFVLSGYVSVPYDILLSSKVLQDMVTNYKDSENTAAPSPLLPLSKELFVDETYSDMFGDSFYYDGSSTKGGNPPPAAPAKKQSRKTAPEPNEATAASASGGNNPGFQTISLVLKSQQEAHDAVARRKLLMLERKYADFLILVKKAFRESGNVKFNNKVYDREIGFTGPLATARRKEDKDDVKHLNYVVGNLLYDLAVRRDQSGQQELDDAKALVFTVLHNQDIVGPDDSELPTLSPEMALKALNQAWVPPFLVRVGMRWSQGTSASGSKFVDGDPITVTLGGKRKAPEATSPNPKKAKATAKPAKSTKTGTKAGKTEPKKKKKPKAATAPKKSAKAKPSVVSDDDMAQRIYERHVAELLRQGYTLLVSETPDGGWKENDKRPRRFKLALGSKPAKFQFTPPREVSVADDFAAIAKGVKRSADEFLGSNAGTMKVDDAFEMLDAARFERSIGGSGAPPLIDSRSMWIAVAAVAYLLDAGIKVDEADRKRLKEKFDPRAPVAPAPKAKKAKKAPPKSSTSRVRPVDAARGIYERHAAELLRKGNTDLVSERPAGGWKEGDDRRFKLQLGRKPARFQFKRPREPTAEDSPARLPGQVFETLAQVAKRKADGFLVSKPSGNRMKVDDAFDLLARDQANLFEERAYNDPRFMWVVVATLAYLLDMGFKVDEADEKRLKDKFDPKERVVVPKKAKKATGTKKATTKKKNKKKADGVEDDDNDIDVQRGAAADRGTLRAKKDALVAAVADAYSTLKTKGMCRVELSRIFVESVRDAKFKVPMKSTAEANRIASGAHKYVTWALSQNMPWSSATLVDQVIVYVTGGGNNTFARIEAIHKAKTMTAAAIAREEVKTKLDVLKKLQSYTFGKVAATAAAYYLSKTGLGKVVIPVADRPKENARVPAVGAAFLPGKLRKRLAQGKPPRKSKAAKPTGMGVKNSEGVRERQREASGAAVKALDEIAAGVKALAADQIKDSEKQGDIDIQMHDDGKIVAGFDASERKSLVGLPRKVARRMYTLQLIRYIVYRYHAKGLEWDSARFIRDLTANANRVGIKITQEPFSENKTTRLVMRKALRVFFHCPKGGWKEAPTRPDRDGLEKVTGSRAMMGEVTKKKPKLSKDAETGKTVVHYDPRMKALGKHIKAPAEYRKHFMWDDVIRYLEGWMDQVRDNAKRKASERALAQRATRELGTIAHCRKALIAEQDEIIASVKEPERTRRKQPTVNQHAAYEKDINSPATIKLVQQAKKKRRFIKTKGFRAMFILALQTVLFKQLEIDTSKKRTLADCVQQMSHVRVGKVAPLKSVRTGKELENPAPIYMATSMDMALMKCARVRSPTFRFGFSMKTGREVYIHWKHKVFIEKVFLNQNIVERINLHLDELNKLSGTVEYIQKESKKILGFPLDLTSARKISKKERPLQEKSGRGGGTSQSETWYRLVPRATCFFAPAETKLLPNSPLKVYMRFIRDRAVAEYMDEVHDYNFGIRDKKKGIPDPAQKLRVGQNKKGKDAEIREIRAKEGYQLDPLPSWYSSEIDLTFRT